MALVNAFTFSFRAALRLRKCQTKTRICCYSISSRSTVLQMHNIQHTHNGYSWALASATASFTTFDSAALQSWRMATRESGLKQRVHPPSSLLFRQYGQHSCGIALVLGFLGLSVVWCERIPWGQRPGLELETLLLETEVLRVDLSIWLPMWGFCTSRRWW